MTAVDQWLRGERAVGRPMDRVDGPEKVTGTARYPSEFGFDDLAYAVVVQSTVAAGRIAAIDAGAAEAEPGVLAVISHANAGALRQAPASVLGPAAPPPLRDPQVRHHGQHVAVVVAETLEQATAAAALVRVEYQVDEPLLRLDEPRAERFTHPEVPDLDRGDVAIGLAAADARVEATYTTPAEHHNPMALFATTAVWDGDSLTVHDTTQWPRNVRTVLAATFGLPEERVRVVAPFVGGAFGAGLRAWPHVVLAALAARRVDRPVKLVLTRAQMFTSVGYRPPTVQRVRLGATRAGELTAISHEVTEPTAIGDDHRENPIRATPVLYACPNVSTRFRQVRLNVPTPTWMRGPGESQGVFALECALDELAVTLGVDPVELRLRNLPERNPQTGRIWSSNALRACYERGAERFGWRARSPRPGSMRDGRELIGWGVASAYYPYVHRPAEASARVTADGRAVVASSTTDIGTGTATVMTQIAADALGLPPGRVRFELGDSDLPPAPQQGGSGTTAAVGTAVTAAGRALLVAFLELIHDDPDSPLRGATLDEVAVVDGRISLLADAARGESYADILRRHRRDELAVTGHGAPRRDAPHLSPGIFGAKFAEVGVDTGLGVIRVRRVVSAIDGGRIVNEKTARSQIIGGTVGGIGMALLEETLTDPASGRVVNATYADYLVPVNADVADLEVLFVGEPDPMNPVGAKGVAEIAIVGVAPAIANAVFHATGRRIRALPITLERLLPAAQA
jgi:CO/xanthine dehydrogenase Mo-binding subunit